MKVGIIGGGIIGCSVAAFLAEGGAEVTLFEATALGAGASGRNLGSVQHPYDRDLEPLHLRTLEIYSEMAREGALDFPTTAAGVLLLAEDVAGLGRHATALAELAPMLRPQVVTPDELGVLEPMLAPGLAAIRLETGYPVPPHAAVAAFAARAERAGARVVLGGAARPIVEGNACHGVATSDGTRHAADAVLLAAGPWSPELLPNGSVPLPIRRTWGVTLQITLANAPAHILEEEEIAGSEAPAAASEDAPVGGSFRWSIPTSSHAVFSLATAAGVSALGSTFFIEEPDPRAVVPVLLERARRFLPDIDGGGILEVRRCARPQSVDGRPFIGPMDGIDGLHLCAGHGPWGISTGPASAELAVAGILGTGSVPRTLATSRAADLRLG